VGFGVRWCKPVVRRRTEEPHTKPRDLGRNEIPFQEYTLADEDIEATLGRHHIKG
jgi:hypothetical protein